MLENFLFSAHREGIQFRAKRYSQRWQKSSLHFDGVKSCLNAKFRRLSKVLGACRGKKNNRCRGIFNSDGRTSTDLSTPKHTIALRLIISPLIEDIFYQGVSLNLKTLKWESSVDVERNPVQMAKLRVEPASPRYKEYLNGLSQFDSSFYGSSTDMLSTRKLQRRLNRSSRMFFAAFPSAYEAALQRELFIRRMLVFNL